MKTQFKIKIPCSTSNLGSGFDTLGLALQLYLEVEVNSETDTTLIENYGNGAEELPQDESNYIYRIYKQGCEFIGAEPQRLILKVHNNIPLSRGLGSSGAAVVAGLAIANELNGGKLTRDQIAELATRIEGHPENVSASCFGGLTVGCLAKGKLFSCKIDPPAEMKAIAIIPNVPVLTKEARQLLPEYVPFEVAVHNVQRAALFAGAMATGNFSVLHEAARDKLHQPFRKKLIPGFDAILAAAYEAGAHAAFLSGSGSTIIALTSDREEQVQNTMLQAVNGYEYSVETKILGIARKGYHQKDK